MNRILAIDPALKTGWAAYTKGIIEHGVQDFSLKRGESRGMIFLNFRKWLEKMFIKLTILRYNGLVIYEMPHHRGGAATEILIGMTTRIQEECDRRGINYTSVHSAHLKKFATGKGNADKDRMLSEARRRFGEYISDHNEADALLMLEWAREEFEIKEEINV